jgi:hypothetical protein
MKLYAPLEYWQLTNNTDVNGCGTGGWKNTLVPETLWGLSVTEACNIHDWMYLVGKTNDDKVTADRVFLNNMTRIINANRSCWVIRILRLRRAKLYYEAVKYFGGPAFWHGKNPLDTYYEQ